MYRITTLFGYIAAILLLILCLVIITVQNILGNQKIFDPVLKGICRLIPRCFGIRVMVEGLPDLDRDKGHVFFANHVNVFDPILLYGYIPNFVRGVELESHFSWPLWGSIVKRLGNIPISHSNPKSALESLRKAGEIIQNGTSIIIFPEGHRTRSGELQPFQKGSFRLARNAGADMIPIVFKGLWERKTIHTFFVKPGTVRMIFGELIPFETVQSLSDRELRDRGRELIMQMLE